MPGPDRSFRHSYLPQRHLLPREGGDQLEPSQSAPTTPTVQALGKTPLRLKSVQSHPRGIAYFYALRAERKAINRR
jgi:hypothetical protein